MIGVSPEKLELRLKKNETASRSIFLQNLEGKEERVQIKAAKFEKLIEINPDETSLPPQEIVPIEIIILGEKNFQTELEISTLSNQTSELAIQSGVKIPITVEVENALNYPLIFGVLLLSIAVAVLPHLMRNLYK